MAGDGAAGLEIYYKFDAPANLGGDTTFLAQLYKAPFSPPVSAPSGPPPHCLESCSAEMCICVKGDTCCRRKLDASSLSDDRLSGPLLSL